jgi:hypothetical protein
MPFQPKPAVLSREQRNLWRNLSEYIRQEGGWTVSQPDCTPIRFEVAPDSELPQLLTEAGHRVRSIGTHERLIPQTITLKEHGRANTIKRQEVGIGTVAVYQFELPPLAKVSSEI